MVRKKDQEVIKTIADYYGELDSFIHKVKKDRSLLSRLYTLKNKKIRKCEDIESYLKWYSKEDPDLMVSLDRFKDISVMTVFLGYDLKLNDHVPVLFETMVVGGKLNGQRYKYATYGEASMGHRRRVKRVEDLSYIRKLRG